MRKSKDSRKHEAQEIIFTPGHQMAAVSNSVAPSGGETQKSQFLAFSETLEFGLQIQLIFLQTLLLLIQIHLLSSNPVIFHQMQCKY